MSIGPAPHTRPTGRGHAFAWRVVADPGRSRGTRQDRGARPDPCHPPVARKIMSRSLKIAVADDKLDMRDYFQRILPLLGHQVVAVAQNGRELVDLCAETPPDLV